MHTGLISAIVASLLGLLITATLIAITGFMLWKKCSKKEVNSMNSGTITKTVLAVLII